MRASGVSNKIVVGSNTYGGSQSMSKDSTRVADVAVQDRQRDRAARGIRSRNVAAAYPNDRPSPPRRRRPAMAALAVLLIIGGAALAGLLALRLDSREPVLVLNQDVAVGTRITESMLSTTNVASDTLMLIPENQAGSVIGTFARTSLTRGQLADTSMLTTRSPFGSRQVQVGVPLTTGKVPSGLRSGDEVRLVRIGDGSNSAEPLAVGLVLSVDAREDGGSLSSGGGSTATILVPGQVSDLVIDAAGNDMLGMALIRRGVAADEANLVSLRPGS
jgi:hypothetical protein